MMIQMKCMYSQQIVVDCSKLIKLQISERNMHYFLISQKTLYPNLINFYYFIYIYFSFFILYINKIIEKMLSHDSIKMKNVYQLIYNEIIFLISSENLYLHKKKKKNVHVCTQYIQN